MDFVIAKQLCPNITVDRGLPDDDLFLRPAAQTDSHATTPELSKVSFMFLVVMLSVVQFVAVR